MSVQNRSPILFAFSLALPSVRDRALEGVGQDGTEAVDSFSDAERGHSPPTRESPVASMAAERGVDGLPP